MPRPPSGATKDRLVRVQARSVTGPRHRPPRAGAEWPCSQSPEHQSRDRPEVAPRSRQIDPSEQMLRLASAPRIRPLRAGSRTILAPMGSGARTPDPCNTAARVPWTALETAEREGRFTAEGWRQRKDGTRFWASVVLDAIPDESGQLIGFANVTRDLTERREAELELQRSQHALFQAQKMEAVGQLT